MLGSIARRVARPRLAAPAFQQALARPRALSSAPVGDVIAFTGRDERNRFDIFTVEPGSGYISRLTQDQGDNKSPTWSPDGRYVAFSSTRGGSSGSIYVMTADGYFQHNITPNGAGFETPRWGG